MSPHSEALQPLRRTGNVLPPGRRGAEEPVITVIYTSGGKEETRTLSEGGAGRRTTVLLLAVRFGHVLSGSSGVMICMVVGWASTFYRNRQDSPFVLL